MRVMLGLVLVATLAAVPTAAGERQRGSVTVPELRAYFGKVGPLSSPYVKWKGGAWRAVDLTPLAMSLGDPETAAGMARTLRRAQRELTTVAGRMGRITAPAGLRLLHTAFTRSITAEAVCTGRVADEVEIDGSYASASRSCKQTFIGTTARQKHWRTEFTAAARRLGVVVPFWMSKMGVHPK